MNDVQFYFIFIELFLVMVVLEIGVSFILDNMKEIKKLLEKYVNQESQKGE